MAVVINTIELESEVIKQLKEDTKDFSELVYKETAMILAQTAIWIAIREINNNPEKYIY